VTDRAVIAASVVMAKALAAQIKATVEAVAEFDRQIERLCQTHQDYEVFASLPGSGTVYSSRLLAAFGTDRTRFASAERVACLAGVAPVVERSGQSKWVHWRLRLPEVPAAKLRRVRGRVGPPLLLGEGVLHAATC
jgi:transposase